MLGWPVFCDGEYSLKVAWAGRAASKRWEAALQQGCIGALDEVDFIVAVYDKAAEL